jgi:hypothetical protein
MQHIFPSHGVHLVNVEVPLCAMETNTGINIPLQLMVHSIHNNMLIYLLCTCDCSNKMGFVCASHLCIRYKTIQECIYIVYRFEIVE